jgi:O-antigen/teichoic acid export membrane protein
LLPEHYGVVAMIIVFIDIANVFVISGFKTALVQKKDADETDFSTIFYCSLSVSVILYLLLFLVAPYIATFYSEPLLGHVLRVFALQLIIGSYSSIQHAYVERNMLFRKYFFSTLLGTISSGIVGIMMAYFGFGVWALIAQYFTNSIVDIIILNITVSWRPQCKFSWKSAHELMSYGWKILAADLIGTFFDKLRSLTIGRVYTTTDLALYNRGQQIPSLITNNISASVMAVLFPALSNEKDDIDKVKNMIRRAVMMMAYIMTPLLFGMAAVSEPLILILLTDKWSQSIPYMQLLCLSSAISLIGTTSLQVIKAIGRSDVLLSLETVKKPVYFLLLIIGVKISVLAVAVTMLVYSFYGTVLNSNQLRKLIRYSFKEQLEDLIPPIALSIIMAVLVWSISLLSLPNVLLLLIQTIFGVVFYISVSHVLKLESYVYTVNIIKEKITNRE